MVTVVLCAVMALAPASAIAQSTPTPPAQGAPAAPTAQPTVTETVIVVGTTPLPGVGTPIDSVPAPVQTATAADIDASRAPDLAQFMTRRLTGVNINEVQGNPFQPDVTYRGYTASPLLGTPQGVSVFVDGMRMNQPFGDVVSWDLIPRSAIGGLTLIPGSNPVFGLNTLGGSLAIETKTGLSAPGTSVQALGGRDARRAVEFEHGGSRQNGVNWFLTGNLFADDGWRPMSESDVKQIFGRIGKVTTGTDVAVTVAFADNSLNGNGLQELQLLERDRSSIYTLYDNTRTRAASTNLLVRRQLRQGLTFTANGYYRHVRTSTYNGDINEGSLDQSLYQPNAVERAALAAAGYTGYPTSGESAESTPFPYWRCIAQSLLEDEPGEKCNALNNRTASRQQNGGMSAQLTQAIGTTGPHHLLTVGGAFDASGVDFTQSSELGYLNPDRSVTGLGIFADGVSAGEVDGEPLDLAVDLGGQTRTASVYATDTMTLGHAWHLTVSGRYNRTSVHNTDRRNPGGGTGSLDGDDVFGRFNPAVGATVSIAKTLTGYAGYSEGSRAPTSTELGCADPEAPCRLPNAMAGDPPLAQVVTRTLEAGLRGHRGTTNWSAGWFRAENSDDILFVLSDQTGFGYFTNFGATRRQGLELSLRGKAGMISWATSYTLLDATFQSPEQVNGSGNSENEDGAGLEGAIDIEPGNRIPLIPRHAFKASAGVIVTPALTLDVDLQAQSGSYARGNENNAHQPDGVYYLGAGRTDPYLIVNVGARYRLTKRVELFGQVNNLFDAKYNTAAQLGVTGFTAAGTFQARPFPPAGSEFPLQSSTFFAPGAPITAWGGVRVTF